MGRDNTLAVDNSFTDSPPKSLGDVTAGKHVVKVEASGAADPNRIAGGVTGGVIDARGSLVIHPSEQNGSGVTGIAVLPEIAPTLPGPTHRSSSNGERLRVEAGSTTTKASISSLRRR